MVSREELIGVDFITTDHTILTGMGSLINGIQLRLENSDDLTEHFENIMVDLAHRKVTNPSDEPICIATMVGLSLESLYDKSTKQIPLSNILRALPDQLPQELIFLHSPRMQEPGLCWAPVSLLTSTYTFVDHTSGKGVLDSMGFNVSMNCFLLEKNFRIHETTDEIFGYRVKSRFHKASFCIFITEAAATRPPGQTIKRAAILIQKTHLQSESASVGALVELIEEPQIFTDQASAKTRPTHIANMKWRKLNPWLSEKHKIQQCNFLALVSILGSKIAGIDDISHRDIVETKGTFHQQRKFRLS